MYNVLLYVLIFLLAAVLAAAIVYIVKLKRENLNLRKELSCSLSVSDAATDAFTYLAIGNSITLHGEASYWWNECGMAASVPEKDYVHLVSTGLQTKVGKVNTVVHQFFVWEAQAHDRSETLCLLDAKLNNHVDLITVQLGENVQEFSTFERDLTELLEYLRRKAPHARIIMLGDFWDTKRNGMRKRAAEASGSEFADISQIIGDTQYQCGMGSTVYGNDGNVHTVDHSGVAMHPGDKGMRFIADTVLRQWQSAS